MIFRFAATACALDVLAEVRPSFSKQCRADRVRLANDPTWKPAPPLNAPRCRSRRCHCGARTSGRHRAGIAAGHMGRSGRPMDRRGCILSEEAITEVARLQLDRVPVLSAVTTILSNLISKCAGCSDAQAIHRPAWRPAHRVADCSNGLDARRQFYSARLDRQPDRRATRRRLRSRDRLLGLFQGWQALTLLTLLIGTLWLWV